MSTWYGITLDADGECITSIDLSNNNLIGTLPDELGTLTSLTSLYLNGNMGLTGSIPDGIGNMFDLEYLIANDCGLNGEIPDNIGNLYRLEELNLSGNELTGVIPASIVGCFSLQTLNLSDNLLTGSLPTELTTLNLLTQLQVNDNQLSGCYDVDLELLCSRLGANSTNALISDGNSFDAPWVDFCNDYLGKCPTCEDEDYIALRALYLSTDGDGWNNNTGWPIASDFNTFSTLPPDTDMGNWFGVTLNEDGCVSELSLLGNNNNCMF